MKAVLNFSGSLPIEDYILDSNKLIPSSISLIPMGKSGIHIKKKNVGKFTEYCGGKVTDAKIQQAKHSSNPVIRKRAVFAENARKWKHRLGGKFAEGGNVSEYIPGANAINLSSSFVDYLGAPSTFEKKEIEELNPDFLQTLDYTYSSPIKKEEVIEENTPSFKEQLQQLSNDAEIIAEPAANNSTQTTNNSAKAKISDEMFQNLLGIEGSHTKNGMLMAHAENKKFGETFVTGPYGMTQKHIDKNGNLLKQPTSFKEGELVSKEWALANAHAYYDKQAAWWKQILGNRQVTQHQLDALVSASCGTQRSVRILKQFVLENWGNWDAIVKRWKSFATTSAGNGKVQPGLVTRRQFEANWFVGSNQPWSSYRTYRKKRLGGKFQNGGSLEEYISNSRVDLSKMFANYNFGVPSSYQEQKNDNIENIFNKYLAKDAPIYSFYKEESESPTNTEESFEIIPSSPSKDVAVRTATETIKEEKKNETQESLELPATKNRKGSYENSEAGHRQFVHDLNLCFLNNGVKNEEMRKVLVAQAALESGYGAASLGGGDYNYGNLTTGSNWKGKYRVAYDRDAKGNWITQKFRSYDSMDDYVKDKLKFIGLNSRYKVDINRDTPLQYIEKVVKGGYAEDPNYYNSLKNMYENWINKRWN